MSIEESLHRHLKSLGPVNDLVGSNVAPMRSKQGTGEPRVVYELIAGANLHDFLGTSGVDRAVYQVHCWAADYAGAKALAEAIRAVDGHRGWLGGDGAAGGTWVQVCKVEDASDDNQPPIDSSDEALSRVILDLSFFYDV